MLKAVMLRPACGAVIQAKCHRIDAPKFRHGPAEIARRNHREKPDGPFPWLAWPWEAMAPPAPVPAQPILGLPDLEAESGAIQNVAPRSSISRGGSLPAAGREKLAKLPLPSKRLR